MGEGIGKDKSKGKGKKIEISISKRKEIGIRYKQLLDLSDEEVAEDFLIKNQNSAVRCKKCRKIYHADSLECSFCRKRKDYLETAIDLKDEKEDNEDGNVYSPYIAKDSDIDKLAQMANGNFEFSSIPTDVHLHREFLRHFLMYMRFMDEKSFIVKEIKESHQSFFTLLPENSPLKSIQNMVGKKYPKMQQEWRKHKHERKKIEQKINIAGYIKWDDKQQKIKCISTKSFADKFGFDKQLICKEKDLFLKAEKDRKRNVIFDFVTTYKDHSKLAIEEFYKGIRSNPNNPLQENIAFHHFFRNAKQIYPYHIIGKTKSNLCSADFSQLKKRAYLDCIVCEIDQQEYYFPLYKFIGRKVQNKNTCSEYIQAYIWEKQDKQKEEIKQELSDLHLSDDTFNDYFKRVENKDKIIEEALNDKISKEEQEEQESCLVLRLPEDMSI